MQDLFRTTGNRQRKKQQMQCRAQREAAEMSQLVNQELLLFLVQQEYDAQLQRALNTDKMDLAQELRNRIQMIAKTVEQIQAVKRSGGQPESSNMQEEMAESLRLRSNLQEAIVEERYDDAAQLRDRLKELQASLDAASGKEAQLRGRLQEQRQLNLGQRVVHSRLGYRGVVCGWDAECTEGKEWQEEAGVSDLQSGPLQPFYHVLVDMRDWDGPMGKPPLAYLPQELLSAPEPPRCWVEEHGEDTFQHPYAFSLFLGPDERGDLIPSRALREKFNVERRDIEPPESAQGDDDSSSGPDDSPDDSYCP